MLKWTLIVVGALVGVVVLIALVGWCLPKGHSASRTATFTAAPAVIYATITDVARSPEWRSGLKRVDVLPDDGKGMLFREDGPNGVILYRMEAARPAERVVTRIADPSLAFGGTWTYSLVPNGTGTSLTITEDGEVYNPIFRFMSKFVFSPYASIDTYLADLRKRVER